MEIKQISIHFIKTMLSFYIFLLVILFIMVNIVFVIFPDIKNLSEMYKTVFNLLDSLPLLGLSIGIALLSSILKINKSNETS